MNYQELTNRIKANFTEEWLTPSQQQIFLKLLNGFKTHKIVNVYGKQGVGKTFLAWNLSAKLEATFTRTLDINSSEELIVLDDYKHSRSDIRHLFSHIQLRKISKVFIFTSLKAQDDIVSFELNFTEQDKKIFKSNIYRYLGINFAKETPNDNMHKLIKNNL